LFPRLKLGFTKHICFVFIFPSEKGRLLLNSVGELNVQATVVT